MPKLGLKLWSVNTDYYYEEALRLYQKGIYDYIELYVVPDTLDSISKWASLPIPFTIHAPHFAHGLNFSVPQKRIFNKELIAQTKQYAESLKALYTVFHPGIGGDLDETLYQMSQIKDIKFLVENKPYVVLSKNSGEEKFCIGSEVEHIHKIMKETGCGFCFDIGHALCTANYLKEDVLTYLKSFNQLNPVAYHISDNIKTNIYDQHLHLGTGTINFQAIKEIINTDKFIAIETNKDSKDNLNDYEFDVQYLRSILDD